MKKDNLIKTRKNILKAVGKSPDRYKLLVHIKKCSLCNKKFFIPDFAYNKSKNEYYKYIVQNGLCYECAYWSDLISSPPKYLQIANGKSYKFLPFVKNKKVFMTLGGSGQVRYFITKDFQTFKSNDVWLIGTIPEQFRKELQDTGWFCDARVYRKITNFNGRCEAIGCLDRYKCFRYDLTKEPKDGPYNIVPENWIPGGEHCGFFINIDSILNYNSLITNQKFK